MISSRQIKYENTHGEKNTRLSKNQTDPKKCCVIIILDMRVV